MAGSRTAPFCDVALTRNGIRRLIGRWRFLGLFLRHDLVSFVDGAGAGTMVPTPDMTTRTALELASLLPAPRPSGVRRCASRPPASSAQPDVDRIVGKRLSGENQAQESKHRHHLLVGWRHYHRHGSLGWGFSTATSPASAPRFSPLRQTPQSHPTPETAWDNAHNGCDGRRAAEAPEADEKRGDAPPVVSPWSMQNDLKSWAAQSRMPWP